jgi:hypothetical protein
VVKDYFFLVPVQTASNSFKNTGQVPRLSLQFASQWPLFPAFFIFLISFSLTLSIFSSKENSCEVSCEDAMAEKTDCLIFLVDSSSALY